MDTSHKAKPTSSQLKWHESEIGVLIHYDINVFEPEYKFRKQWGYSPDPSIFNPKLLDTDQWIETAKAAGAKYAILVVKHCSGFCLWPSKNYDYSVAQSPYKDGKGDIVQDFINSCKKYGLKPGFYYSTVCNAFMKYDKPGNKSIPQSDPNFEAYSQLVEQQLAEIWGNYGELFEIWFDGGHVDGGPDIIKLLQTYQPNAVCFQGPKGWESNLRWVGNERGHAPYPCWCTINDVDHYDGTKEIGNKHSGNKNGKVWMPAETDTPNRYFQWFWMKNQEYLVKPAELLLKHYYESVGRNSNLLLGMVIDTDGLVPEEDGKQFKRFGEMVKNRFDNPIYQTNGEGDHFLIKLDSPKMINQIVLQEDIREGHSIFKYQINGKIIEKNNEQDGWTCISNGSCIGYKRVEYFEPMRIQELEINILASKHTPKLTNISLHYVDPLPKIPSLFYRILKFVGMRIKKIFTRN